MFLWWAVVNLDILTLEDVGIDSHLEPASSGH